MLQEDKTKIKNIIDSLKVYCIACGKLLDRTHESIEGQLACPHKFNPELWNFFGGKYTWRDIGRNQVLLELENRLNEES